MASTPSSNTPGGATLGMDDDDLFPEPGSNQFHNHPQHLQQQQYQEPPHSANSSTFVRPRTPQNDHLNAAVAGELSPPRSHSHLHSQSGFELEHPHQHQQRHHGDLSRRGGSSGEGGRRTGGAEAAGTGTGDPNAKPGSGWRNKRAEEEMQRAWENVVDRDFSLKEYGDVMAFQGRE